MTVRRHHRRGWILLPAITLLVLAAAGCTRVEPHAAPSSTPPLTSSTSPTTSTHQPSTTSRTPSTTAATAEQAVIRAYNGMWADMAQAAQMADYRSLVLAAHTVDPATGQLQRTLLTYSQLGVVGKGTLRTNPRVTSLDGQTGQATLVDCLDDRDWLTYDATTGKPTDNQPGGRTVTDATLRSVDGAWRVSSYLVHRGQTC